VWHTFSFLTSWHNSVGLRSSSSLSSRGTGVSLTSGVGSRGMIMRARRASVFIVKNGPEAVEEDHDLPLER
jgi:hypothetical protein